MDQNMFGSFKPCNIQTPKYFKVKLIHWLFVFFLLGNAWFGSLCEDQGCPGEDGSCNGHGTCDAAISICSCYPGWRGEDCNTPICPGTPECSGRFKICIYWINKVYGLILALFAAIR